MFQQKYPLTGNEYTNDYKSLLNWELSVKMLVEQYVPSYVGYSIWFTLLYFGNRISFSAP